MSFDPHEQLPHEPTKQQIEESMTFKEVGNSLFKQKEYEQAVEMYTKAINKNPKYSIFYSNRARCYFNLKKYEQSYKDAEQAILYDDKNIKAYSLSAQSSVQIAMDTKDRHKIQNAIKNLKKSLTLCPSQGKNQFEREFVGKIYLAKKKLWELNSEQEIQKKKKIRSYLVSLVESDHEMAEQIKDELNQRILKLMQTETIDKSISKVPRALICPITKMILKDPICNQYGHSYSREAYLLYLQHNQNKDPITGNKVIKNLLYPNINVKKAIELFLEQHPWAYDQVIQV